MTGDELTSGEPVRVLARMTAEQARNAAILAGGLLACNLHFLVNSETRIFAIIAAMGVLGSGVSIATSLHVRRRARLCLEIVDGQVRAKP